MQFSIVTLIALATFAVAQPNGFIMRRQNVVDTETPAMSDKQGNVVPFDTATVNQPNTDAGA